MKSLLLIPFTFGLAALAAVNALAQGSLTPPGTPAPTMKRLDQIEARTLIPGGAAPFVISAPGSYYLAGNLTVASGNAITVNSSNVTVDLNGFTIFSTASPAAGTAVLIASGSVNVTVRDGHIFGAGTVSVTGAFSGSGFANGVFYASASSTDGGSGLRVRDVTVTGCSGDGINLLPVISSLAEGCFVRHVGNSGVNASVVRASIAAECGLGGIAATSVSDCTAFVRGGSNPAINGTTLVNCTAVHNGTGTAVSAAFATNCYGYAEGGFGLSAQTAAGCFGRTNTGEVGLNANEATNCEGRSDGGANFSYGLSARLAVGCTGQNSGTNNNTTALRAIDASHCYGFGGAGMGVNAQTAEGCCGETNSVVAALVANVATNCTGKNTGNGLGLQANNAATNCFGTSVGGGGLRTPTALNCFGQSSAGTAAAALFAVSATSCRGYQTTGAGEAIHTDIAVTCTSQAGTITATVGRYLMP